MHINTEPYPFLSPFNGCADPHTFDTLFADHPLDDEQLEFFAAWLLHNEQWDPFMWLVNAAGGMHKLVPRVPGLFDSALSMKPSAASTLLIRHGFLRAPYWMHSKVKTWRKHPIHAVVRKGDTELLSALLAHNPYFEQLLRSSCTQEGRTLLFEVTEPKMAKKLLELRVPVDTKDNAKVLALDHHIQKLREQAVGNPAMALVVGALMGVHVHRHERHAQAAALALDYPHLLDHLMQQGLMPNTRLEDGTPMLSVAVARGAQGAVLALLEAGADPTLCDNGGKSALEFAQGQPVIAHLIHQTMARTFAPQSAQGHTLTLGKSQRIEE